MQEKTRKVYFNCIFNPIWFVYLVCIALSLYSSHHNYCHSPFYPLASRPHRDHLSKSKKHHKHIISPCAFSNLWLDKQKSNNYFYLFLAYMQKK